MASVVIENFNGTTPRRADGTRWSFLIAGGIAVVANHNSDLINALDGNYLTIPEYDAQTALLARGTLALNFAAIRQAELFAEHFFAAHGEGTVTEDDLTIIMAPRSETLQLPGPWVHPVTMIGVATDYTPYNARPVPLSNIVLIDPYGDVTLLRTPDEAGVLEYLAQGDA